MLFMVIELTSRMAIPNLLVTASDAAVGCCPDSVVYLASWIDSPNSRCFQIMEASDRELLNQWIAVWDDLVDFEVVPVQTSAEFWGTVQA